MSDDEYERLDYARSMREECEKALEGNAPDLAKSIIEGFISQALQNPENVDPSYVFFVATCLRQLQEKDFEGRVKDVFRVNQKNKRSSRATFKESYLLMKDLVVEMNKPEQMELGLEPLAKILRSGDPKYAGRYASDKSMADALRSRIGEYYDFLVGENNVVMPPVKDKTRKVVSLLDELLIPNQ